MVSASSESDSATVRILYVDDDVIAGRMFAHEMGKKRGYSVDVVSTVQSALSHAFAQTYDVVVSDLVMPGMDGIALIATLQEFAPDTVFVIVSGLPETQVQQECDEGAAEVASVVCKPWRPDDMDRIVQAALRHRGGDDAAALGNVLVVDGDLGDAVLTQCYLEDLGYRPDQVRHCTSVKEALAVIERENIDVVLSDLALPDDPNNPVAQLRAAAPDAAFVVLTDNDDAEQELKAVKNGAHNVLRKTPENYTALGKNLRGAAMRMVSERRLVVASHEDALTGALNRRALETRTRQAKARARRSLQRVGFIVLDVTNLEFVRCMIGAHAADQLLVQAAAQIRMTIREEDEVARIGSGGRFVILLEQLEDSAGAWACVNRLREALEPKITVSGIPVDVPISIGVALHPDDGGTLDELIEAATPVDTGLNDPWELSEELFGPVPGMAPLPPRRPSL